LKPAKPMTTAVLDYTGLSVIVLLGMIHPVILTG
jgi:hypothetical protein